MKRILALIMVALLALTCFAGCGPTTETPATGDDTSTTAPAGEKSKIYLITMDSMDQYWLGIDAGCKAAAAELDVEYIFNSPDKKDDAKQVECINNAVADGANAILIAANGPGVASALKDAEAAGVKIIYVDAPTDAFEALTTFATDNQAAGKTAGEEVKKALADAGTTSGKIGVVSVNNATDSTLKRDAGFRSAFEGTDFELLETQFCEGDAVKSKDAADNFIAQGCVALFGANEGSAVGVGNAVAGASGTKPIAAGFDNSDAIKEFIKDGSLLCTMAQNPDQMGDKGLRAAVEAINGTNPAEKSIDTGVTVINKDNVDN